MIRNSSQQTGIIDLNFPTFKDNTTKCIKDEKTLTVRWIIKMLLRQYAMLPLEIALANPNNLINKLAIWHIQEVSC